MGHDEIMSPDQFKMFMDVNTMRLNGHGENIRANRAEMVQGFKDINSKIDILVDKVQNVQLKVMAISSFIAAAISLLGLIFKK